MLPAFASHGVASAGWTRRGKLHPWSSWVCSALCTPVCAAAPLPCMCSPFLVAANLPSQAVGPKAWAVNMHTMQCICEHAAHDAMYGMLLADIAKLPAHVACS